MNILSISTILPIPGLIRNNDYILQVYSSHREIFNQDTVVIVKPVRIDPDPVKFLKRGSFFRKLEKYFSGEIMGFRVEILPFFSAWRFRNLHALVSVTLYWMNARKMHKLFSAYRFDIIHAQYILPDGLLAWFLSRKYGIPYLVTTHNERFYFDHGISRMISRKILQNAKMITPINYNNYLYFQSLGLSRMSLIPLGFNMNFVREQKKVSVEKTRLLTVAELIPLKNIDKVLFAVKELIPKHDLVYTIIGTGPEKQMLSELVHQLQIEEYVVFIDRVAHDAMADEMHKYDIFIMPSYFETFGRVYFEAMAMGIPIICAKNSGIYGIFREGEEGFSVDHNDIASLTRTLDKLISDQELRLRVGLGGKKLVERYTWENIARTFHDLYNDIVLKENNKIS